jgi:hypothetical protein
MKPKEFVTCVVQACCGSDISSSSGVLFDQENGIVLTHSAFLLPHLCRDSSLKLSSASFKNKISFSVIIEKNQSVNLANVSSYKTHALQVPTKTNQRDKVLLTLKATFFGSFHCGAFEDDLLKMMPKSRGWKFSDKSESHVDKNNSTSTTGSSRSDDDESELYCRMLPVFVILHIQDFKLYRNHMTSRPLALLPSSKLAIGTSLYVLGTPFGDSSPHIFINSVSKGILCSRGCSGTLLLTDARCIPGVEGGMVYINEKSGVFNRR